MSMNESTETSPIAEPFAQEPLTDAEARVLGSLIEKQATTPETYPLTVNALVSASNQKTSREPVMSLEPGQVAQALRKLEQRELVRLQMGARADRWEQRAEKVLELVPAQLVLLALLLLRGPQTVSELLSRSTRMHHFEDSEQLQHHLTRLVTRGLARQLPRQSGQREARYIHLLAPVDVSAPAPSRAPAASGTYDRDALARIEQLEARVAELEERLARLE